MESVGCHQNCKPKNDDMMKQQQQEANNNNKLLSQNQDAKTTTKEAKSVNDKKNVAKKIDHQENIGKKVEVEESTTKTTTTTSSNDIKPTPPTTTKIFEADATTTTTNSSATINGQQQQQSMKSDFDIFAKEALESRQRMRRLQSEIDEKNEIILLLRDELESMRESNIKLERDSRQLALEVKKFQTLQDEYDELKGKELEGSKLELELVRLKEKLAEFDFLKLRIAELEDDRRQAQEETQQFELKFQQAQEKLNFVAELEREINKLQTKAANFETERDSFESKLLQSIDRETRLQINNKQAEEEIKRLRSLVKYYQEKRDEEEANNSLIMSVADLAQMDNEKNNITINNLNENNQQSQSLGNNDELSQMQQMTKHDNGDTSIKFELDKQLKLELSEENENLKKHISEQAEEIKNLLELKDEHISQLNSNKQLIYTLRQDLACEKTLASKLDKRLALMSRQIRTFDDSIVTSSSSPSSSSSSITPDTDAQEKIERLDSQKEEEEKSSRIDTEKHKKPLVLPVSSYNDQHVVKIDNTQHTAKQESFDDDANVNNKLQPSSSPKIESWKPNLILHVTTKSPSTKILAIDTRIAVEKDNKNDHQTTIASKQSTFKDHDSSDNQQGFAPVDFNCHQIDKHIQSLDSENCKKLPKSLSPANGIQSGHSNCQTKINDDDDDHHHHFDLRKDKLSGPLDKINPKVATLNTEKHQYPQINHDNLSAIPRNFDKQMDESPTSNLRSQSSSPSTTITFGHDSGFQSINQDANKLDANRVSPSTSQTTNLPLSSSSKQQLKVNCNNNAKLASVKLSSPPPPLPSKSGPLMKSLSDQPYTKSTNNKQSYLTESSTDNDSSNEDEEEDDFKLDDPLKVQPRAPTPVKSTRSSATKSAFVRNAQPSRSVNYGHHRPTIGYLERVRASLQASTSTNTSTNSHSSEQQHTHRSTSFSPLKNNNPTSGLFASQTGQNLQQQPPSIVPCQSASQFSALIDAMSPQQKQQQHENLIALGIIPHQHQHHQHQPLPASGQQYTEQQFAQLQQHHYYHHLQQMHQLHQLHHHQLHMHIHHQQQQMQQQQAAAMNRQHQQQANTASTTPNNECSNNNGHNSVPMSSKTMTNQQPARYATSSSSEFYPNQPKLVTPRKQHHQQQQSSAIYANTQLLNGCVTTPPTSKLNNHANVKALNVPGPTPTQRVQQQHHQAQSQPIYSNTPAHAYVGLPQIAEVNGLPTINDSSNDCIVRQQQHQQQQHLKPEVTVKTRDSSAGSPTSSSSASSGSSSSSPMSNLSPSSSSSMSSLSQGAPSRHHLNRSNFIRHSTSMTSSSHSNTGAAAMLARRHFSVERDLTTNGPQPLNATLSRTSPSRSSLQQVIATAVSGGSLQRHKNQGLIKQETTTTEHDGFVQRMNNIKLDQSLAFSSLRGPKSGIQMNRSLAATSEFETKRSSMSGDAYSSSGQQKQQQQQMHNQRRAHSSTPDRRQLSQQPPADLNSSGSGITAGSNNNNNNNNSKSSIWFEYGCV